MFEIFVLKNGKFVVIQLRQDVNFKIWNKNSYFGGFSNACVDSLVMINDEALQH